MWDSVTKVCVWAYKFCNLDPKQTHGCWVPFLTHFRLLQSDYSNQSSADDENWELFKADDFRMYCMKVPTPALPSPAFGSGPAWVGFSSIHTMWPASPEPYAVGEPALWACEFVIFNERLGHHPVHSGACHTVRSPLPCSHY